MTIVLNRSLRSLELFDWLKSTNVLASWTINLSMLNSTFEDEKLSSCVALRNKNVSLSKVLKIFMFII